MTVGELVQLLKVYPQQAQVEIRSYMTGSLEQSTLRYCALEKGVVVMESVAEGRD